jgi:hypothetical protein
LSIVQYSKIRKQRFGNYLLPSSGEGKVGTNTVSKFFLVFRILDDGKGQKPTNSEMLSVETS